MARAGGDYPLAALHFGTHCVAGGAPRLGDDQLLAQARDLEALAWFAQFARQGYPGRLTFSESGREAHRRAGVTLRYRRDNAIAVLFARVVDNAIKTAEMDALSRLGGYFTGVQGDAVRKIAARPPMTLIILGLGFGWSGLDGRGNAIARADGKEIARAKLYDCLRWRGS